MCRRLQMDTLFLFLFRTEDIYQGKNMSLYIQQRNDKQDREIKV